MVHCVLCPHADEFRIHIGFGIDEELPGRDDYIPFGKAGEDLHAILLDPTDPDRSAPEPVVGEPDHDPVRRGACTANQRRRRNRQRQLGGYRADAHVAEHPRAQCELGIVEHHAHLQCPALHVQRGIQVVDLSLERASGQEVEGQFGKLAFGDSGNVAFEYLGHDPHRVQPRDGQHLRPRLYEHALAHGQIHQEPVPRRADLRTLWSTPPLDERGDLLPRHAERTKTLAGGASQCRLRREKKVLLCTHQFRGKQLEEQIPPGDRIAFDISRQVLDPAGRTRVHVLDQWLCEHHGPHRTYRHIERGSNGGGHAHSEVVLDPRGDPDARIGRGVLVDGHEIHPHRRLPRTVAAIARIHRRNPVKRFVRALVALGSDDARHLVSPEQSPAQRYTEQQGHAHERYRFPVHCRFSSKAVPLASPVNQASCARLLASCQRISSRRRRSSISARAARTTSA